VKVKDVNDLPPKFSSVVYSVTIDEEMRERQSILQVIFLFFVSPEPEPILGWFTVWNDP